MVTQQSQPEKAALPLLRDPNEEYWTVYNGVSVKVAWGAMTRKQKLLQLEAERRQQYVQEFGIYQ